MVDDTYNASPAAARAAIDFVAGLPGEAWVVLGDMGELGEDAPDLHAEVGRYARARGVARFYGFGALAGMAAEAFGGGRRWDDIDALAAALGAELGTGINVLIKGSRSMRMERLVERLVPREAA